ncbi:hypothetical protein ACPCUF_36130 [Streptomyces griseoincarnatus]
MHRSDAGSQYTSFKLAEHLDAAGIAASIGSVGDVYDNALMKSTIGLFKTELIKQWRALEDPAGFHTSPSDRARFGPGHARSPRPTERPGGADRAAVCSTRSRMPSHRDV